MTTVTTTDTRAVDRLRAATARTETAIARLPAGHPDREAAIKAEADLYAQADPAAIAVLDAETEAEAG